MLPREKYKIEYVIMPNAIPTKKAIAVITIYIILLFKFKNIHQLCFQ